MKDRYKENIIEINRFTEKQQLYTYIQKLSFSLDDIHEINFKANDDKIKEIYYSSYFIIINSMKLFNTEFWDELNEPLKKAAESLEVLSNSKYSNKLNNDELLFDAILIYSITNYYSRAYVLTENNKNLNLPKYKEVIYQFMNRDLENLRINLLGLLNSDECNEKILIEKFKNGIINKFEALEYMLSYSIFKSLNNVLNYVYSGKYEFIESSLRLLEKYGLIALNYGFVEFSWTIDILKIMLDKFHENSFWNQLKPFNNYDDFHPKLKEYIINYASLKSPILELWPSQLEAMKKIIEGNNFTVKMPTSAGKTLVAELSILKYLIDTDFSGKIIYLSPFKSLSTELELKFKKSLGKLGLNISEFYGNFEFDPFGQKILDYYDLFILTPEKFDSLLRTQVNFKENIGLIIIDEGHIIGENNKRGLKFELLVNRMKKMFENSRLIFISGVLPNIEDFTKWLANDENNSIKSNWKPSDVLIGTLTWYKKKSVIQYFNGEIKRPLKFMNNIYSENNATMFPKKANDVLALSSLKFANDGQTYIFSPVKDHIETVADAIVRMNSKLTGELSDLKLKIDNEDEDIIYLKEQIVYELGPDNELSKYLECGFLIHHGSLPENIKLIIEDILRKNKVKLVIGTNTLAQGINFPIKTVLIKSIYRGYLQKIDEQTLHNIIGRAGRANEENAGRVLLVIDKITKNSNPRIEFKKLVYGNKRLESSLYTILQEFKEKFKDSELNFEEFCLDLAEKTQDKKFKELINSLDIELFSFIEENEELTDSELLELIIRHSLYDAQFPDNSHELKILLNSRIQYLKNQYSQDNRSLMYKLGFNLPCCEVIDEDYEYLKELFSLFEKWDKLKKEEKLELLYLIATFFFDNNIFQTNMYYEKSIESYDEKILKYWIEGRSIYEISEIMKMDQKIISSLIRSFKNTFPWLITNTMIFLENQNHKYGLTLLDPICEYIPTMFRYGIFNLKMAMLLYEYNDLRLCEKLYDYIDTDENSTYFKLYDEIMNLKIDFPFEIDEPESKFLRNYPKFSNSIHSKSSLKIKIRYFRDCEIEDNELVILKNNYNTISIFNMDSTLIQSIDKKFVETTTNFEEIRINEIWNVKIIEEHYVFEKI